MEVNLITKYIAVWGWQILAMMFLSFSFVFLALPSNLFSSVFYVAFFLIFIICEYMSLKRKGEFNHDEYFQE